MGRKRAEEVWLGLEDRVYNGLDELDRRKSMRARKVGIQKVQRVPSVRRGEEYGAAHRVREGVEWGRGRCR